MPPRFPALAVALALTLAGCSGPDQADTPAPEASPTAPADTLPARWWQWAETAGSPSPIADPTGGLCEVGQPDDVWFLAGTFGGPAQRDCRIPADRPVYFPVLNRICYLVPGDRPDAVLDDCSSVADEMSAVLDGDELEIVEATSEGSFPLAAGPDSLLGLPEGETEAVAWGHWVGPLTLPSGTHELSFHGRTGTFELSVTYDLTVG